MPLDHWLPEYDVRERHEGFVAATPERSLALALAAPSEPDAIVRALFRLRGVPHAATIEGLFRAMSFETLERTPTSFVAGGGRGVRIVFDVVARAEGAGSVLSTETRVHAPVTRARMAFRLYWLVVGPFSALIRRRWLRAIARAASQ